MSAPQHPWQSKITGDQGFSFSLSWLRAQSLPRNRRARCMLLSAMSHKIVLLRATRRVVLLRLLDYFLFGFPCSAAGCESRPLIRLSWFVDEMPKCRPPSCRSWSTPLSRTLEISNGHSTARPRMALTLLSFSCSKVLMCPVKYLVLHRAGGKAQNLLVPSDCLQAF